MVIHHGQLGTFLLFHLKNLQFPIITHAEKPGLKVLSALFCFPISQKEPGLDVLNCQREHGEYIVVILAGLFKLVIQFIAQVQAFGIPFIQFHIFAIGVLDFSSDLADILHNFLGRNHIQHITELEVNICHSLGSLCT